MFWLFQRAVLVAVPWMFVRCCEKNKMPILSDNSYIRQETERRAQYLVITSSKSTQHTYTRFSLFSRSFCFKLQTQTLKIKWQCSGMSNRVRVDGTKCFVNTLYLSLQLTDGGKAAKAKMSVGDIILSINGISTDSMNHLEAQNKIKACTGDLSLTLQR